MTTYLDSLSPEEFVIAQRYDEFVAARRWYRRNGRSATYSELVEWLDRQHRFCLWTSVSKLIAAAIIKREAQVAEGAK